MYAYSYASPSHPLPAGQQGSWGRPICEISPSFLTHSAKWRKVCPLFFLHRDGLFHAYVLCLHVHKTEVKIIMVKLDRNKDGLVCNLPPFPDYAMKHARIDMRKTQARTLSPLSHPQNLTYTCVVHVNTHYTSSSLSPHGRNAQIDRDEWTSGLQEIFWVNNLVPLVCAQIMPFISDVSTPN